jgi:ribosomal protein S18 acetylase RimI-like enzyme
VIEIRTFAGTPQELHEFVVSVWKESYDGQMAFPQWTAEYLDWQLDLGPGSSRDFVIAAYDGGRITGVLLACPFDFQTNAGVRGGILSSWLSIDPSFRGQGLVGRLKAEQARRLTERGGGLVFAYRYIGSRHSLSKPPTDADMQTGEWSTRKVGFWVRVLDARRAIAWYVDRANRVMTRLGSPFLLAPSAPKSSAVIRDYEPQDLPACLELVTSANAGRAFSIKWNTENLSRHCRGGFGRCLVAERDGQVRGFVTFHVLPFQGRTVEPVGIIDVIAIDQLSGRERRAMIGSVLRRIAADGGILALRHWTGDAPVGAMLISGFIPLPRDSYEALRVIDGSPRVDLSGKQQILWR